MNQKYRLTIVPCERCAALHRMKYLPFFFWGWLMERHFKKSHSADPAVILAGEWTVQQFEELRALHEDKDR